MLQNLPFVGEASKDVRLFSQDIITVYSDNLCTDYEIYNPIFRFFAYDVRDGMREHCNITKLIL